MTRRRTDPKGDTRTTQPLLPPIADTHSSNHLDIHGTPSSVVPPQWMLELDILSVLSRGDGWLRMTMPLDGKWLYVKYKLNSKRWPNHYVMVSGPVYQLAPLLGTLRRKLELVDAKELVPTEDHYFTPNS